MIAAGAVADEAGRHDASAFAADLTRLPPRPCVCRMTTDASARTGMRIRGRPALLRPVQCNRGNMMAAPKM